MNYHDYYTSNPEGVTVYEHKVADATLDTLTLMSRVTTKENDAALGSMVGYGVWREIAEVVEVQGPVVFSEDASIERIRRLVELRQILLSREIGLRSLIYASEYSLEVSNDIGERMNIFAGNSNSNTTGVPSLSLSSMRKLLHDSNTRGDDLGGHSVLTRHAVDMCIIAGFNGLSADFYNYLNTSSTFSLEEERSILNLSDKMLRQVQAARALRGELEPLPNIRDRMFTESEAQLDIMQNHRSSMSTGEVTLLGEMRKIRQWMKLVRQSKEVNGLFLPGDLGYTYVPSSVKESMPHPPVQRPEKQKVIIDVAPRPEPNPDLDRLLDIASEHRKVVDGYLNHPNKAMRALGIVGGNKSLQRKLMSDKVDANLAERLTNVYAELINLVRASEDPESDLINTLVRVGELEDEYYQTERKISLQRKPNLDNNFDKELAWLETNWNTFEVAVKDSDHSERIDESVWGGIKQLLNIPVDNPKAEVVAGGSEQPEGGDTLSALAKEKINTEQLDWVVLPTEQLSDDDLHKDAQASMARTNGDSSVSGYASDELYRMEALHNLWEEFRKDKGDATLYRSAERILGDPNCLYYVLRFTHPGDGNVYVVAENPAYGNATYVMREDLLPLLPGETALTFLKELGRKSARELGAIQVKHTIETADGHIDKIRQRIEQLAELEAA